MQDATIVERLQKIIDEPDSWQSHDTKNLSIAIVPVQDVLDAVIDLKSDAALIERQQQVIDLLMKAVEPFSCVVTYEHLCRVREAKVEAEKLLNSTPSTAL